MKRLSAVLLIVALGAAQSCGDGTGPVAGVLNVGLVTPSSDPDGALVLTVTGPEALMSASAGAGLRLFSQGGDLGATTRFALTGTVTNGVILTIGVADVRRASHYVATIDQVAGQDLQLRPVAGYSLTVSQ
ncbi:MAG TPA: hypothetical protein VFU41_13355 [Gemmatimonadales bacterium]|nr:hypothetical protein [Gemmatimonadales bacterium]